MSYFAEHLKKLRLESGLSMQDVADQAKVCKAMICKIERNETQPTLDVAGRLAKAFGKTLSEMLHAPQSTSVIHLTEKTQAVWEDSQHIIRRNISPIFEGLKIEWLQVVLPPGLTSVKANPVMSNNVQKFILVTKGTLGVMVNQQKYLIKKGESFYFDATQLHDVFNPGKTSVEYFIVIRHG